MTSVFCEKKEAVYLNESFIQTTEKLFIGKLYE